jgi:hypothetical protein
MKRQKVWLLAAAAALVITFAACTNDADRRDRTDDKYNNRTNERVTSEREDSLNRNRRTATDENLNRPADNGGVRTDRDTSYNR